MLYREGKEVAETGKSLDEKLKAEEFVGLAKPYKHSCIQQRVTESKYERQRATLTLVEVKSESAKDSRSWDFRLKIKSQH